MSVWGTAAEVLEPVFDLIEGGRAVDAAEVTELIADNGAKLFDITSRTAYAANGSAANVAEVVNIESGAASGVTTGAGILAMDVGAVGAAIAPALGILAGVGLYNLAPEFWTNVSNALTGAGQTSNGKVVGLIDGNGNTSFSQTTIEIFKNAFLAAGAFSGTYSTLTDPQIDTGLTVRLPVINIAISRLINEHYWTNIAFSPKDNPSKRICLRVALTDEALLSDMRLSIYDAGDYTPVIVSCKNTNIFAGGVLFTIDPVTKSTSASTGSVNSFSKGDDTYYYAVYNWLNLDPSVGCFSAEQVNVQNLVEAQWSNNFQSNASIQDGATLPDENPFEETYPDWLPKEFTIEIPLEYPVSIPTPTITQNPSQSGDNADENQLNDLIKIFYDSVAEIDPDIEPDPDPSEETAPEPAPDPDPSPNPPDPNPPVPPSPPTIPISILDTTSATRMFTVYSPTDSQVSNLGAFLWTDNIIEQIKKLWDDPMQAIISFHKVYGAPVTGSSKNIVLGYIDSGVSALEVTSQFTEIDCGTVQVPERLHNATDYSPFTSLTIYLPFIGFVELDTNELMNSYIHLLYRIDVYTGTCAALLYARRDVDMPQEQLLYTFSGNASQQLPLTASSFAGAIGSLLSLAGAGISVASGGAMGVAAGAITAAHSLTQEMVHIKHSGGLSSNAGILAPRKPYLILSRQYGYDASGYAGFYGLPANKTVYIGNAGGGYIKCKDVIFKGSCTEAEADEIVALLKEGVYL